MSPRKELICAVVGALVSVSACSGNDAPTQAATGDASPMPSGDASPTPSGDAAPTPPDDAPATTDSGTSVANDDTVTTARNVPVRIDVRMNDTLVGDWDITAVGEPERGEAVITAPGEVRYTPSSKNEGGVDGFTYTLRQRGSDETRTAKVSVTILADLGTVSGGRLYRANDDTTVEEPLGFGWMAIANDGRLAGGSWERDWFVQAVDGTRTKVPFPTNKEVVERAILDFGADGRAVGYYTLLGADQSYSSVSVTWAGGAADLVAVATGVNQVYGSNASGALVGSNIHVYPETYSGVWVNADGTSKVFQHPDASIKGAVFYDVTNDGTVLGYTDTAPGRCFLLEKGVTFKALEAPVRAGWERQSCYGINEKREIVGTATLPNYRAGKAFRITADGAWHQLVFPFPRRDGEEQRAEQARAINDAGVIVGVQTAIESVKIDDKTERKTVWHPVRFTPIDAGSAARFDETLRAD
jgi:hypothetical protein